MQSRKPPLPALTVKLSKYNVDDVALGVCKTGAEEAGVTEVRTSLSEKKFEPLLVMRSNLWASGYDVDGTDQTSLGQFSGRVQQTYKHSVPRFFVPEHGTMFTLALVR